MVAVACIGHESKTEELNCKVSEEDLRIVVVQIRRIVRTANLEFALRVGAVILHHFYDGSTDAWRSRGPKIASFRRLAKHPDLPLSPGALYRCVALYELCERLNAPTRWEHLGASHLREVLSLPPGDQERMLVAANKNRWTVRDFQRALATEKVGRTARGGRPAQPQITRTLRSITKSLVEHRAATEDLNSLSAQEVAETIDLLDEARNWLESMASSLRNAHADHARAS